MVQSIEVMTMSKKHSLWQLPLVISLSTWEVTDPTQVEENSAIMEEI